MVWLNTQTLTRHGETKRRGIIAVDFDGTIVYDDYPNVGSPNPGAVDILKELTDQGFRIILHTLRDGDKLQEAILYCNKHYIDIWAINDNPEQEPNTNPKKVFAHAYIDDRSVGIPLRMDPAKKACVDWPRLRDIFVSWGVLKPLQDDGSKTFDLKKPVKSV